MEQSSLFDCPCCKNTQTQTVASVVGGGNRRTNSRSAALGAGFPGQRFGGVVTSQTITASHLAQILAPPAVPRRRDNPWGFCIIAGGFGCYLLIDLVTDHRTLFIALIFVILALLFSIWLCGATIYHNQVIVPRLAKDVEVKINRWHLLSYCNRCNAVFDGKTRSYVDATEIHSLL